MDREDLCLPGEKTRGQKPYEGCLSDTEERESVWLW